MSEDDLREGEDRIVTSLVGTSALRGATTITLPRALPYLPCATPWIYPNNFTSQHTRIYFFTLSLSRWRRDGGGVRHSPVTQRASRSCWTLDGGSGAVFRGGSALSGSSVWPPLTLSAPERRHRASGMEGRTVASPSRRGVSVH